MTLITTPQLQASIDASRRAAKHNGALADAQRAAAVAAVERTAYEIADQLFLRESGTYAAFMRACGFDPGEGAIAAFLAGGPIGNPLGEPLPGEDGPSDSNGYDDTDDPEIDPTTGEPFDAPDGDPDPIAAIAASCLYSEEGGFDAEGNDLGSVDALISYKNALENELRRRIAAPSLADVHAILSGAEWSADTLQDVAVLITRAGFTIAPPA